MTGVLRRALGVIVAVLLGGWVSLAVLYRAPGPVALRAGIALVLVLASVAVLRLVRRGWRRALAFGALVALVLAWWLSIAPSNARDWQPDVAVLAWAERDGDSVTVHDVRNNEYRTETDYTVRHEDRRFSLAALRTMDLFLSYWGSPLIAHTIISFGFDDGRYLAMSIETRKERGEEYSAVAGFFKEYELIYVVADERDVVRLRTNYRGEDVYLYRLLVTPELARQGFLEYLRHVNRLREHPEWYNALTHNCTTAIRGHTRPPGARTWTSWKLLVNGYLDELAYDIGAVTRSRPFPELRARSRINEPARAAGDAPDFSRRIRQPVLDVNSSHPIPGRTT
jgi:hypothetical protein